LEAIMTAIEHPHPSAEALALSRGAYDLHVHIDPDVIPRRITDLTLAPRFLERGLRGFGRPERARGGNRGP